MKIAFSLTNLELGGAQVFVTRLASELAATQKSEVYIYDHNPEYRNRHLLANIDRRVKVVSYCESALLRFFVWKINGILKKFNTGAEFKKWLNKNQFRRFIKKNKIGLVNSHMSASDFIVADCKQDFRFIPSLHGEYEMAMSVKENSSETREKIRHAILSADAIIYSAEKNISQVRALVPDIKIPLQKIYVGFNPANFTVKHVSRETFNIPANAVVLGMISRGIPEKGWKTAVETLEILNSNRLEKIFLFCIGDGDYLKELVVKRNNPYIILKQFENDFQDYFSYYSLFDVFIFPTEFKAESVPNVIIEALYWKKPIIASDIAEISNMISTPAGELAGTVVPVREDGKIKQDEFRKALEDYVNDSNLRALKSSFSADAFEKFKMQKIMHEYLSLFKKTIAA